MRATFWIRWPGVIILFSLIVLAWISTPFIIDHFADEESNKGVFGDQFGAVTALFSGLAFAGLILTLLIQSQELQETRKGVLAQTEELKISAEALKAQVAEMANQHSEMEEMRKAQQAQADYLLRQSFENTFFQMIRVWNEHIESICEKSGENVFRGRDGIWEIAHRLVEHANAEEHEKYYMEEFSNWYINKLGPYFTLLMHILIHIKQAPLEDDAKKKYAQFLRANLTEGERRLILCNCAFTIGQRMRGLVEEFGLLKGIYDNYLSSHHYLAKKFKASAFGK